jgi:hypothetical protein
MNRYNYPREQENKESNMSVYYGLTNLILMIIVACGLAFGSYGLENFKITIGGVQVDNLDLGYTGFDDQHNSYKWNDVSSKFAQGTDIKEAADNMEDAAKLYLAGSIVSLILSFIVCLLSFIYEQITSFNINVLCSVLTSLSTILMFLSGILFQAMSEKFIKEVYDIFDKNHKTSQSTNPIQYIYIILPIVVWISLCIGCCISKPTERVVFITQNDLEM